MKIRPILFSTPMVSAILNGSKNQTRREIKPQPIIDEESGYTFFKDKQLDIHHWKELILEFAKYQIGDIIWTREAWQYIDDLDEPYVYRQKEQDELKPEYFERMKWKPSIHMAKEACRLFLECTNVRVERLQDVSSKDAQAEGAKDSMKFDELEKLKHLDWVIPSPFSEYQFGFLSIWCNINGIKSWESNPWVWVYDFKITERPTNFLDK